MKAFGEATDTAAFKLAQFKQVLIGFARDVGDQFISAIGPTVDWIKKFMDKYKPLIPLLAKSLVTIAAVSAGLFIFSKALKLIVGGISLVITALSFLVTWPGLIIAGLTLAAAAFVKFTNVGADAFEQLKSDWSDAWKGIVGAIKRGDLALAGQIAFVTLKKELMEIWFSFTNWWREQIFTLKIAWEKTSHFMTNVWINQWFKARVTYEKFSGWLKKKWKTTSTDFELLGLAIKEGLGLIDREVMNERMVRVLELEAADLNRIENTKDAALLAASAEHAKRLRNENFLHEKNKDNIFDEHNAKRKAINDELTALKKQQKALVRKGKGPGFPLIGIIKETLKDLPRDVAKGLFDIGTKIKDFIVDKLGIEKAKISDKAKVATKKGGELLGVQEIFTKIQQAALGGTVPMQQLNTLKKIQDANDKSVEFLEKIEKKSNVAVAAP